MTRPVERTPNPSLRSGVREIERLLVRAAREIQLLAALTPTNALVERDRLTAELGAGRTAQPCWTYAPVDHAALRAALDDAAASLSEASDPIELAYLRRARELSLEAALCEAAGTGRVGALSRARFEPADAALAEQASFLCATWLADPPPAAAPASDLVESDSSDPRSLLSRMRAAVGHHRLPFAVVVHQSLAPLAATGERVILVARARPVSDEDAARTVAHEIEGHALPRAAAAASLLPLLRIGTARGCDDQEGRALLVEQRLGFLGTRRRRQLAARHRAFEAMQRGASFHDAASMLLRDGGLGTLDAVVAAERVFRGGDGTRPGLGRERIYLESLVRVRAHLERHPGDDRVMARGQVGIDEIATVKEAIATST